MSTDQTQAHDYHLWQQGITLCMDIASNMGGLWVVAAIPAQKLGSLFSIPYAFFLVSRS